MSDHAVHQGEGTYPPPCPDGWCRVAAVDAFCPHRGANLADGVVKGDRLRCPFHGWQPEGCGQIRTHSRADAQPRAHRHWEAIDYYGTVMMYRSACADARAPYGLPPLPEIDSRQLVPRGQYDAGEVDMHIIEFAENSMGFQHFSKLHGVMRIPWTSIRLPWIRIRRRPSWSLLDDRQGHISYFGDEAKLAIGGWVYVRTRFRALTTFKGPGSIVKFDFSVPRAGDVTMFQTHTPVAALRQRGTFRRFAARCVP